MAASTAPGRCPRRPRARSSAATTGGSSPSPRRVLGSRDEAEDVAQEVFLSFGRSSVPAGEARGWLSVAAAHTALNHLRSGRRRAVPRGGRGRRPSTPSSPDVADEVVALEERGRVRAALARLPQQAGRGPGAAAQRPELRRGRGRPRPVPRQRRHHRATRRVRPSQGVEPSCVIRLRACCAGCSTSRPAWPTPTVDHVADCPVCLAGLAAVRDGRRRSSAPRSLRAAGGRRRRRRLARGCPRPRSRGAGAVGAAAPGAVAGCGAAPSGRRRRSAVAVVLAGAGTAAANDWLPIFRTERDRPGQPSAAPTWSRCPT